VTAAETQAFRGLLDADDRLQVFVTFAGDPPTVEEPRPPLPPLPYVLIHPERDQDEQHRATGPWVHRRPSWAVHAVAESAEAAEMVMGWVDDRLRPPPNRWGVVPVVEGQVTKRIKRDDLTGVLVDDSSLPAVCYVVASYSFESAPA
jgi:hypothetical protein